MRREIQILWEVDGCSIVVDIDAVVAVVLGFIEVSGTMPMYLPFVSTIRCKDFKVRRRLSGEDLPFQVYGRSTYQLLFGRSSGG